MRKLLILALVLAAACGGDSSTAVNTNVTGTWAYTVSNVSTTGVSCSLSNVRLTLTQTGSTFTGSASAGGVLTCSGFTGSSTTQLGGDVVANGTISGSNISFDIGTSDFHNAGTINGNSINGTVTLHINTGTQSLTATGSFTAVRQ